MSLRKGITPIVSTLLLLLVVVVLIALALTFFTRTFESVSATTSGQADESMKRMGEDFKIDSIDNNRIYVRNRGTYELEDLRFYANDASVNTVDVEMTSIPPGEVGCFALNSTRLSGLVEIKVTGSVKNAVADEDYTGVTSFYTSC